MVVMIIMMIVIIMVIMMKMIVIMIVIMTVTVIMKLIVIIIMKMRMLMRTIINCQGGANKKTSHAGANKWYRRVGMLEALYGTGRVQTVPMRQPGLVWHSCKHNLERPR